MSAAAQLAEDACHESAHATAAVLLGARVAQVRLNPDRHADLWGWVDTVTPEEVRFNSREVSFAGPWATARWRAGHTPTRPQIRAALAGSGDADDLAADPMAAVAGLPPIDAAMELLWPTILQLAKPLCTRGSLGHRDVTDALGLSVFHGPIVSSLASDAAIPTLQSRVPALATRRR